MRLNRQWSSLDELIGAAVRASRRLLSGRNIETHVPPDLPLVRLDAVLVERKHLAKAVRNTART